MSTPSFQRLTKAQLPALFAQAQREKWEGLVLLLPGYNPSESTARIYIDDRGFTPKDLFATDEPLTTVELAGLCQITSLRRLALPGHSVGEAGARAIAENLPQLYTLYLGANSVGEAGARAIAENLRQLHTLNLGANNVGDAGACAIAEKLSRLHTLHFSRNKVGDVGARVIAENLSQLHTLNLWDNSVGEAGAQAIAQNLPLLHILYLSHNNVGKAGAQAIAQNLPLLHTLYLSHNNVGKAGAEAIAQNLPLLHTLDLSHNNAGNAGARVIAQNLPRLHILYLSHNKVGEAGARAIAENLRQLHTLYLGNNNLTDTAVRFLVDGLPHLQRISVRGNKKLTLPEELIGISTDAQALRDYFRRSLDEGTRQLNEAKLIIVGHEAAGKTSLVNYLVRNEPCRETEATRGVSIQERINVERWATGSGELLLNVWDFGGQEVQHETHKLFLTARSLYLVVLEARRESAHEEEKRLHSWMRAIQDSTSDSVPVIVVINKSEDDKDLKLDEVQLKETYKIKGFPRTSCRDPEKYQGGGKGIVKLRELIVNTIREDIPQASALFPESYFQIKDRLQKIAKEKHTFGVGEYTNLCHSPTEAKFRVTEEGEQQRLLIDIGVVIQHRDTTLLDPNWLTTAIYRILTHNQVSNSDGILKKADLDTIFQDVQYLPTDKPGVVRYPQDRWQYIIDQTVECGLSVPIPDEPDTYLVPEQLSPNTIKTGLDQHDKPDVLRFRYDYFEIPKGLFPRFIVEMHRYLENPRRCWANGVVLEFGQLHALVVSDRQHNRINIFVHGPQPQQRETLRLVREGLERVHTRFKSLEAKAMVPIPGSPEDAIEYQQLRDQEDAGTEFKRYLFKGVPYVVSDLLDGIAHLPPASRSDSPRDPYSPPPATPAPASPEVSKNWKWYIPAVLAASFSAILLGLYEAGVEVRWLKLGAIPVAIGAVFIGIQLYFEFHAKNWPRVFAGVCLGMASGCMLAPGVKLLVHIDEKSTLEAILDNAPWVAILPFLAGCYFAWLQFKKDDTSRG
jgi:small GTP-binding protein